MRSDKLHIRCAVCNESIEHVYFQEEVCERRYTLIVYCHGSRDSMNWTLDDMIRHGDEAWRALMDSEGVAFAKEATARQQEASHASDALAYAMSNSWRNRK